MPDVVVTKRCPTCGEVKQVDLFFSKNRARPDGWSSHCKTCTNQRLSVYAKKHPEKARERSARHKTKSPEAQRLRQRLYRQRHPDLVAQRSPNERMLHPDRVSARKKVHHAVKTGRLIKPSSCERCGLIKSLNAHHPDYSRPLDVIWLCSSCHKIVHPKEDS